MRSVDSNTLLEISEGDGTHSRMVTKPTTEKNNNPTKCLRSMRQKIVFLTINKSKSKIASLPNKYVCKRKRTKTN